MCSRRSRGYRHRDGGAVHLGALVTERTHIKNTDHEPVAVVFLMRACF